MAKKMVNITAVDITVVVSLMASFLVGQVVSFMVLKTLLINFTENPPLPCLTVQSMPITIFTKFLDF